MKHSKDSLFSQKLLAWFDQYGRKDLPWQKNITPYRVWVSEIMLQQTQVNTVIPYYKKFIKTFPTLKSLAESPLDNVLKQWAGLGYYSRARNLHRTAQIITEHYNGRFPKSLDTLQTLPGIGRSTAGAIAAIAMEQKATILDGNVKRVLTRYFAIEGWSGTSTVINALWEKAEALTPSARVADYTQAIMDLGAVICTRTKPRCKECPFQNNCQAKLANQIQRYPSSKPKKSIPTKTSYFLMLINQNQEILLEKRPLSGIWGGLWSFPENTLDTDISQWCYAAFGYSISTMEKLPILKHTFSHFHLEINPIIVRISNHHNRIMENDRYIWYNLTQAMEQGIATPVKQLLEELNKNDKNG